MLKSVFVVDSLPFLLLAVRRAHIIEDTRTQLAQKRNDLKKPLKGNVPFSKKALFSKK